ncbi:hypothetical protein PRIPAC_80411 [Pristionchus pacificus]|uniref:Copper transport protein n=1 Tax=Pristionchus pacificus TaxID=54126 RepID=A0A2A6CQ03_PRIPA|nr:hypothetical protein PRIPAC_80411 [Pristionchus pacificus]|eukprot:PDM80292.1 hypothetical protein PRIPAC_32871 [Pristionchus pacificus]
MDMTMMGHKSEATPMSAMTLHFGADETVLFDFWKFSSTGGLILSCLVLVVFSIVKEATRVFRAAHCGCRLLDGILHAVILTLSYFLMVIFMNLNVWMCITIVVAEVLCHAVSAYFNTLMNVNFFEK